MFAYLIFSQDMETDGIIQETLRDHFSQCTVIAVAHRVDTIMAYDHVAVLADGKVSEIGNPKILLENPKSKFYSIVHETSMKQKKDN